MLPGPGLSLLLLLAQQGGATAPPPEGAQHQRRHRRRRLACAAARRPRVVLFIEAPSPPPPAMRGPHVLMTDRQRAVHVRDRLTAGTFRIDAMKAGYVRPTDPTERPTFRHHRRSARRRCDGSSATRGREIAGRILDRDGEPMTEARVQASPWTPAAIGVRGMPGTSAMTNDLGEFRLFGLAPGDYLLVATPQAAIVCFDCGGFDRQVLTSTYYPERRMRSREAGQGRGGPHQGRHRAATAIGAVVSCLGHRRRYTRPPGRGASIRLMADAVAAGNSPGEVQSDANGRFRLYVRLPGSTACSRYRRGRRIFEWPLRLNRERSPSTQRT